MGLLCVAFVSSSRLPDRDLLNIARSEIGVREKTGKNDGARVEEYLHAVGLHRGDPWCAAWISWIHKQAGYPGPRTGWSPSLFPLNRLVKEPVPGDVFGVYIPSLGRIGHCGIIEKVVSDYRYTLEGNTNNSGGAEGDGVYRRMRHKRGIRKYANWRAQQ